MLNNTLAIVLLTLGQASGGSVPGPEMSLDLPPMDLPSLSPETAPAPSAAPSGPVANPDNLPKSDNLVQPGNSVKPASPVKPDTSAKPGEKEKRASGPGAVPPGNQPGAKSAENKRGNAGVKPGAAPLSPENKPLPPPAVSNPVHPNDRMISPPASMREKAKNQPTSVDLKVIPDPTAPLLNTPSEKSLPLNSSTVAPVAVYNDPALSSNYLDPAQEGGSSDLYDQSLRPNQGKGHIMPLDQVEIPAQEAGTLTQINVREGLLVEKGDTLAQIEDEQVKMAQEVQRCKLESAEKEASNDVNIRYSKAASAVADAEVNQAKETNARVPGAVPSSEVRRLELALVQTELQIEQAQHQFEVAKIAVDVQKAELQAAVLGVERRKVISPISGVVVEKYRNEGEWVRPGDPILKIIYLDRLRAKTTLDINKIRPDQVVGHKATVELAEVPNSRFKGKKAPNANVVFVNPIIQPGGSYEVWVEVENQLDNDNFYLIQPGMNAIITITAEKSQDEQTSGSK